MYKFNKYKNKITIVDGIKFRSIKESKKYVELKLLKRAGAIIDFERQVPFTAINQETGKPLFKYYADFVVYEVSKTGKEMERQVIDVKGVKTDVYKIKKKVIEALYEIKIIET